MDSYFPALLARAVPRYTSYPTAAEFTEGVGAAEQDAALRAVRGDVSLYLHIPFCREICWYCGCNTGAANRQQRLAGYLDTLHREIAQTGVRLHPQVRVRRVSFGGGSPNAIAPTDFVRLVDALTLHFSVDSPEWSVELDPRTLTAAWCETLGAVGVTRASLGVQTFAPHLQSAIGRIQPDDVIATATARLRAGGITSLNFDLMYGLPGQTMADLEASLARTVELSADRIALFGYAHVPHLLPRQRRIDASALPDQAARFAMARFGHDFLTCAGYQSVGFDHFAKASDPLAVATREGRLHRNFQGFTDDSAPVLIGLGASSISQFPHLFVQNEKNPAQWRSAMMADRLPGAVGLVRSAEDQRRGALIEALLCQGRADLPPDIASALALPLAPFIAHGLARIENGALVLAPHAAPYARAIAALLDEHRQEGVRRFSSAV